MSQILEWLYAVVWGAPALILILGVGLCLSLATRFAQLRLFPGAAKKFVRRLLPSRSQEGTSAFRALCTALAATVGTGNLAGVAGAIAIGGPGAIFWMWISGILGMITKLA
jgi:AGCS family alanine or glycine:cation symporter